MWRSLSAGIIVIPLLFKNHTNRMKSAINKVFQGCLNQKKESAEKRKRTTECNGNTKDTACWNYAIPEFENLASEPERREKLRQLLSWSSLKQWDFNIFDVAEATNGENTLLFVSWALLGAPYSQQYMAEVCKSSASSKGETDITEGYNFVGNDSSENPLKNVSVKKLFNYLRAIENDYNSENLYHNSIHAADVLQSVHALVQMTREQVDGNIDSTPLFEFSQLDLFMILVAAACHDVDHPGLNNNYQINAKTEIALLYKNVSVLENHHASHTLRKMLKPRTRTSFCTTKKQLDDDLTTDQDLNFLSDVSTETFESIRSKIKEAILLTDMSLHNTIVDKTKDLIDHANPTNGTNDDNCGDGNNSSASSPSSIVLMYMMHMADVSNAAKVQPMVTTWADRVLAEFFAQGKFEEEQGMPISPLCDPKTTKRADSQVGFIKFVIQPAFEVLGQAFPVVKERVLPIIETNIDYWNTVKAKDAEATGETS